MEAKIPTFPHDFNLFEEVLNEFTKLNLCKKMYDLYKNEKKIYKSR